MFDRLRTTIKNLPFFAPKTPVASQQRTSLTEIQRAFIEGREIQTYGGESGYRDPFSNHSTTYACMTIISQAMASVPYRMYLEQPDEDGLPIAVKEDPLLDLLADPYPGIYADFCQFIETIALYLEAAGNAWIMPDLPNSRGLPRSLLALGVQHVSPNYEHASGKFVSWSVKIGKVAFNVPGDALIHLKYTDPASQNQIMGIGPLQAAMKSIRADIARQVFDEKFFLNGSSPSLKLTFTPPETRPDDIFLTEEQMRQIRMGIEDQWGGPRNIHKVAIVHGGMQLEELGLSQKEMDFVEGRKWSRQEIAACFRVPVPLLNDFQGAGLSRDGVESAQRMLFENNIVPKINRLSSVLQKTLVRTYSPGKVAGFAIDEIPAMREDMGEKADIAYKFFTMGWPINQINRVLKLGFESVEWGDDWLVANNLVPARMLAGEQASMAMVMGLGDPAGLGDDLLLEDQLNGATDDAVMDDEEKDQKEIDDAVEAAKKKKKKDKAVEKAVGEKSFKGKTRSARRAKQADDFERMVVPLEHAFYRKLHNFFYALRKEMLAKVKKTARGANTRAVLDDLIDGIMFDVPKAQRTIETFARKHYQAAIELGIKSAALTVGEDPIGLDSHKMKTLLDTRVVQVRRIPHDLEKTVRKLLQTSLAETAMDGLTINQQAAALEDATKEVMTLTTSRANRIARTEMLSTVNEARALEYEEQGVEQHSWLSSQDDLVREGHDIDYEVVVVGEPFSNGLRWPGDVLGGAADVVHCRCTTVPAGGDDDQ